METTYTRRDLDRALANRLPDGLVQFEFEIEGLGPWVGARVGDLFMGQPADGHEYGLTLWFPATLTYAEAARHMAQLFGKQRAKPRFMKPDGTDIRPFRSKEGQVLLASLFPARA